MERRYKIFVSYRHADSHAAARIVDFLQAVFGKDAVFHDIQSIPAGSDFRQSLREAVASSELVLAVIGPTWIESFSQKSMANRGDEPDWVVIELEEAFDRGIRVVPAVIHPAQLPSRESLPSTVQELAFRQARLLWPDLAFENSVHQLVDELHVLLQGESPEDRPLRAVSSMESAGQQTGSTRQVKSLLPIATIMLALAICGIWLFQHWTVPPAASQTTVIAKQPDLARQTQIERRVRALRSTRRTPVRERSENSVRQASLGTPDFSNFEILEDEFVWDLTGYHQLGSDDPPMSSFAILTRTVSMIQRVKTPEVRFESRTTGSDLFMRCLTHPDLSREYVSDSLKTTGRDVMKVRQVAIDISSIPVGKPFEIAIESTYWDSLQSPEECWVGAQGYTQSDVIQFLVVFPKERPYKASSLMTAPSRHDDPAPFAGECLLLTDAEQGFVFWEIPFVEIDRVYRLAWEW